MYNHYIPQSDGTYRRNHVPENGYRQPQRSAAPSQPQPTQPPREELKQERPTEPPRREDQQPHCEGKCTFGQSLNQSPLSFLRRLLPKDIDSTDLIIILLLLLSNEDEDDDVAPLLTIALYFLL